MPFVEQISSFQFIAVIIVLFVLIMIANSILSLRDKLRPKEDLATIAHELSKLTTRFDSLDARTTKIENHCETCKEEYRAELVLIYNRLNPVAETMKGVEASIEFLKTLITESHK
jgi:DNA anti-recombination protein RmuC